MPNPFPKFQGLKRTGVQQEGQGDTQVIMHEFDVRSGETLLSTPRVCTLLCTVWWQMYTSGCHLLCHIAKAEFIPVILGDHQISLFGSDTL